MEVMKARGYEGMMQGKRSRVAIAAATASVIIFYIWTISAPWAVAAGAAAPPPCYGLSGNPNSAFSIGPSCSKRIGNSICTATDAAAGRNEDAAGCLAADAAEDTAAITAAEASGALLADFISPEAMIYYARP